VILNDEKSGGVISQADATDEEVGCGTSYYLRHRRRKEGFMAWQIILIILWGGGGKGGKGDGVDIRKADLRLEGGSDGNEMGR